MTDSDATQTRQDDADVSKELRRTLDEHGVKWKSIDFDVSKTTLFYAGSEQYIFDDGGGIAFPMLAGPLTPAQAIAATLGVGTCKRVFYRPTGDFVCSECGMGISKKLDKYCFLHFCPYCGRRVVDE